jgi:ribonucleoside-triphosphate reductase
LKGFTAPDLVEPLAGAVEVGGCVGLAADGPARAYSGIRKVLSAQDAAAESVAVLHALSVNLPRLAHESNRDETYFRAKLAITLQLCATALKTRRKLLDDMMKKGLLPTLASEIGIGGAEYTPLVVNLVGLEEAITVLVGDRASQSSRRTLVEKTAETAAKVFSDRAEKLEERGGVAIVRDEAGTRFARIDADKYGKGAISASGNSYSDIPVLRLSEAKGDVLEDLGFLYRKLAGGLAVNMAFDSPVKEAVTKAVPMAGQGLEYFRFQTEVPFCKNCGAKVPPSAARCKACRSTSIARYATA